MSLSTNDFSKYTNDIQVHKVKKSNLPSKVTGKHMYFIDNEDGTYSVGVSASDGTIKICSDNTDKLQEQINVLNSNIEKLGIPHVLASNGGDANELKDTCKRFIFNFINIPSGTDYGLIEVYNLQSGGFLPSPEAVIIQRFISWYTGDIYTRVYRKSGDAYKWSIWRINGIKRIEIAQNTDLNNLKELDYEWVTGSNAISYTCLNTPYANIPSFSVRNYPLTYGEAECYFRQELKSLSNEMWYRDYDTYYKTWSSWKQVVTSDVLTSLQTRISDLETQLLSIQAE